MRPVAPPGFYAPYQPPTEEQEENAPPHDSPHLEDVDVQEADDRETDTVIHFRYH